MTNTKEKILVAALRLFAVNGYEAVSVSQIAGELGITKGALYKHYKNKRDIFNCIFEYVCRLDVERSRKSGVPEQDYSDMPEAFSHVSAKSLGDYMKEQFRYWSEDEIACNFRKMLTLEQYKSPEMSALYQKVLVSGPLEYIENLLCEMSKEQEKLLPSPHALAIEFYSPFYLLLSMSDGTDCKETKEEIAQSRPVPRSEIFADAHIIRKRKVTCSRSNPVSSYNNRYVMKRCIMFKDIDQNLR